MGGKLQDKVAVITGCSGGIGREIAIKFAEEGAKLSICARSVDRLKETADICAEKGAEVLHMRCDVTIPEDLDAYVQATAERFGTIDILVNNAVDAKPGSPFLEQSEEYLRTVWESGFLATWRLMKLCFPYLKQNGGKIINFSSASGLVSVEGYAGYAATKEAIRSLSRTVAKEWGPYNINVNTLCPSAITANIQAIIDNMPEGLRSPETLGYVVPPLGRIGEPYVDIAPVAVFLASEDSRHITGQNIRADGGGTIFTS